MKRNGMNTKRSVVWGLLAAAAGCLPLAAMPGCELIVSFDRSKIPSDGSVLDSSGGDVTTPPQDGPEGQDAAGDAQADGGGIDGASDTGTRLDAPNDTGSPPADTGSPPADTGSPPADTGRADAPADGGTG
jgi:hypothetical protein